MTVDIRAAKLDDRDQLVALVWAFVQGPPYGQIFPGVTAESVTALVDSILVRKDVLVIVVESGGTLNGAMALAVHNHPLLGYFAEELFWQIEDRYRNPAFGLAPKLLEIAEGWAKGLSIKYLRMTAPAGSRLGSLYIRHGYMEVETAYTRIVST